MSDLPIFGLSDHENIWLDILQAKVAWIFGVSCTEMVILGQICQKLCKNPVFHPNETIQVPQQT